MLAAIDARDAAISTAARYCVRPRRAPGAPRASGGSRASSRAARRRPASNCRPPGSSPSATAIRRIGQPGSARWSATPIVSSIRIELDETALVRPSNAGVAARRRVGGIDDDRRQAARIERRGEREADQPAAEDDHVRAVHGERPSPFVAMTPRLRLTADSAWRHSSGEDLIGGGTMATVPRARRSATWRPTGAMRCATPCGASPSAAGARCWSALSRRRRGRARHPQPDRSVAQHRRRRPADQLARQRSAPMPATRCCSCSGLASVLFLPVIAHRRPADAAAASPPGRIGRGLLLAAIGAVLLGIALGLTSGSAVSGLPGRLGRRARPRRGARRRCGARPDSPTRRSPGPARLAASAAVRACRPGARLSRARPAAGREGLDRRPVPRAARASAAPRRAAPRSREERAMRRRSAAGRGRPSPLPSRPEPVAACAGAPTAARPSAPSRASRSATATSCRPSTCSPRRRRRPSQQIDRAGLERNARLLETVLEDFHVRGDIVEVRPGPGRHHVRAGAGERHQGQPGHPAGRRHRPQHVGAVGARRDHPRPQRDRHRAAQPQARDGQPVAS